ncbi:MAG: CDC48 family AAA ATPase [Thermoplasmata archaeon]|nr:CDC48 family AAA ATPase [Thermoplasmata archaeon]MCI4359873.1 CDC48 family AAA ATPase [Thermoplasmata archaeon]
MGEAITLRVAEAFQQDIGLGTARLDVGTRQRLKVGVGDIVEIKGRKVTAAVVNRAQQEDEGKSLVRVEAVVRRNAGVSIGDRVVVQRIDCPIAEAVTIAPIYSGSAKMDLGPGLEAFVSKALSRRPFVRGDVFVIPGVFLMGGSLPFMVVSTNPKGTVQVGPTTLITIKDETVTETEVTAPRVSYEDIGGLKEKLGRVREMIELPLKHPELFDRLAISPPKGVLLYGPPGTGKTLIAKAVANEAGAHFIGIQGPEIISKYYGESEKELREKFEEAEKNAPSVIFIDELDSIAPRRDEVVGEVERRVVAQLLTLMDGLSGRGNVIVIAATNREEAIDPALRRPGRFDREIEIGVPTLAGRLEILQIHTRGMPIEASDKERERILKELAALSHGFVGADLSALAREAAMRALRRYLPEIDFDKPIPLTLLERMKVTDRDFKEALKQIEPSSLRDVAIEIPSTKWEEVGGLESVKQALREAVELPFRNPTVYRNMGIEPPRGILFYGPPGVGKTLLAKAAATESQANFISIKGPEIMSKWVGDSEKAIRMIFKKARQASPAIVFIDEIDSIAPKRGLQTSSGVTERIVNQLLTSIDGLEALERVVVLAATNRPDILDEALLRTGRFDRLIYVTPPNASGRLEILKVHTHKMPLEDVRLDDVAVRTEGYVGSDLAALCREAGLVAIRENVKAQKVTMAHFEEALRLTHPSTDAESLKFYEDFARLMLRERLGRRREEAAQVIYR